MKYNIYILIILMYTLFPLFGILVYIPIYEEVDNSGMFEANLIHLIIFYFGIFMALRVLKKKSYGWKENEYVDVHAYKIMNRIFVVSFTFLLIQFVLRGSVLLSGGANRGEVRTQLGAFGWLATEIANYAFPGFVSLATVIYFYFSKKTKAIRKKYIAILLFGFVVALLQGGKSNIIYMAFPALIQCSQMINVKKTIVIGILSALSVVLIGTRQMNMSFEDSVGYNSIRATSMSSYGAQCVWDKYPNGSKDAYLTIYGIAGEGPLSSLLGIDRHSPEFLKYTFARQITYDYYKDWEKAVDGSSNLTLAFFSEAVFWLGHNYFWILSILFSIIGFLFTKAYFSSQRPNTLFKNTMLTVYFNAVFIVWLNSSNGSIFVSLFSVFIIIYMLLAYIIFRYVLIDSKIRKRFSYEIV